MSSIGNLASTLLHAVLPINLFPNNNTSGAAAATGSPATQPSDTGELSSFAQVANTLQQLQQSNPIKYKEVTRQIATNLQSAAQSAQSSGDAGSAAQLNQLAKDFANASASGQLPSLQDLASIVRGGHHGHHRGALGMPVSPATSTGVSQLLASLQANGTTNGALNAAAIIQDTLTGPVITNS